MNPPHTICIFLDLEIPAPPPDLFLDEEAGFDDIPPLPPPVDYDTNAPLEYQDKGTAATVAK